jgi:hypothetical protein
MKMYDIMWQYMKNPDRDKVAKLLREQRPEPNHLMIWLNENIDVNKLAFIDSQVKRWRREYFYDLVAYIHNGNKFCNLNHPRRSNV